MAFEKLKKRRAVERERRKIRSELLKSLLLERGIDVFKKFDIRKVIIFGSVADGVCGDMSDVDILVMPLKNSQYWDFRHELEEAVDFLIYLYTDLNYRSGKLSGDDFPAGKLYAGDDRQRGIAKGGFLF